MKKQFINIVESKKCNYDGRCLFTDKYTDYGFCFGERYGTGACPLGACVVLVLFKDGREMKNKFTYDECKIIENPPKN